MKGVLRTILVTLNHVTKCDTGNDCVNFVVSSGTFDLIPAEEKKAEPKK